MKDKIYRAFEILGYFLEFICPFLVGAELIWKNRISDFIIGSIIIVAFIIYRCEKLVKKGKR